MPSIRELREKPFKESYMTIFCRWWSYPFTVLLAKTPVTPNQISFFSFLITVFAAFLFAQGSYYYTLWGALFCWLGVVLDHVDGELARVKGLQSALGGWFDGALDRAGDIFLLAGISIHFYKQYPYSLLSVILILFAVVSTSMWRLINIQTVVAFPSLFKKLKKKRDQAKIGFDTPMMHFLITVSALFNNFTYVLLFFAFAVNLAWIKNIILVFWRERRHKFG